MKPRLIDLHTRVITDASHIYHIYHTHHILPGKYAIDGFVMSAEFFTTYVNGLSELAISDSYKPWLVQHGVVPLLLDLISFNDAHHSSPLLEERCVSALCQLALDEDSKAAAT